MVIDDDDDGGGGNSGTDEEEDGAFGASKSVVCDINYRVVGGDGAELKNRGGLPALEPADGPATRPSPGARGAHVFEPPQSQFIAAPQPKQPLGAAAPQRLLEARRHGALVARVGEAELPAVAWGAHMMPHLAAQTSTRPRLSRPGELLWSCRGGVAASRCRIMCGKEHRLVSARVGLLVRKSTK